MSARNATGRRSRPSPRLGGARLGVTIPHEINADGTLRAFIESPLLRDLALVRSTFSQKKDEADSGSDQGYYGEHQLEPERPVRALHDARTGCEQREHAGG